MIGVNGVSGMLGGGVIIYVMIKEGGIEYFK